MNGESEWVECPSGCRIEWASKWVESGSGQRVESLSG